MHFSIAFFTPLVAFSLVSALPVDNTARDVYIDAATPELYHRALPVDTRDIHTRFWAFKKADRLPLLPLHNPPPPKLDPEAQAQQDIREKKAKESARLLDMYFPNTASSPAAAAIGSSPPTGGSSGGNYGTFKPNSRRSVIYT